jgi:hypothetical protein
LRNLKLNRNHFLLGAAFLAVFFGATFLATAFLGAALAAAL